MKNSCIIAEFKKLELQIEFKILRDKGDFLRKMLSSKDRKT